MAGHPCLPPGVGGEQPACRRLPQRGPRSQSHRRARQLSLRHAPHGATGQDAWDGGSKSCGPDVVIPSAGYGSTAHALAHSPSRAQQRRRDRAQRPRSQLAGMGATPGPGQAADRQRGALNSAAPRRPGQSVGQTSQRWRRKGSNHDATVASWAEFHGRAIKASRRRAHHASAGPRVQQVRDDARGGFDVPMERRWRRRASRSPPTVPTRAVTRACSMLLESATRRSVGGRGATPWSSRMAASRISRPWWTTQARD